MNSILITGCSRGLGLGIVKELLESHQPVKHIFATCRSPEKELNELKETHPNLHVYTLDVTDYASYDNLVRQIDEIVGDEGLNVIFNNAGIFPNKDKSNSTRDDLMNTLEINSVAPLILTRAFIPLLKKASAFNDSQPMGVQRAAIINISSNMGSIQTAGGGFNAYRMSKAALNMATKALSIELKADKILCISIHPGWVRTDMGGPEASLDIKTSCKQMIQTILDLNQSHHGKFIQYNGKPLAW